jgi:putative ATP-binding cassette transporter
MFVTPQRGLTSIVEAIVQRMPEGSLRQALCYPRASDGFSSDAIHRALECTGLAWLFPRLDEEDNWEQLLPLRAQQRLGFARVLLQGPAFLFMEEATDAFDPKGERLILEMLRHELPDMALLTISFHPGLEPLHDRKIVLNRVPEKKYLPH